MIHIVGVYFAKMIKALELEDARHLRAAEGWLGLGSPIDANQELGKISPAFRTHPDVLELRWQIYALEAKWEACLDIAKTIVQLAPGRIRGWIDRSFALHELKRTQEAFNLLLPAADMFPKNWTIPYNLACYETQLGNLTTAWQWLERAFKVGDAREIKLMAMNDPDLKNFWTAIGKV